MEPGSTETTHPDEARIRAALGTVIDPEVGIDLVSLGLIYGIRVGPDGVHVQMTMTTPACPLGPHLKDESEMAILRVWPHAPSIEVEIVWEPPWSPDRMSPEAKRQLGWPD